MRNISASLKIAEYPVASDRGLAIARASSDIVNLSKEIRKRSAKLNASIGAFPDVGLKVNFAEAAQMPNQQLNSAWIDLESQAQVERMLNQLTTKVQR